MKRQIHLLVEQQQVTNIHKNIFTLISDRKPYDNISSINNNR